MASQITTTDTSAPLGGTYSLLDNSDSATPETFDFMYNMPNANREDIDNTRYRIAHEDAKLLFKKRVEADKEHYADPLGARLVMRKPITALEREAASADLLKTDIPEREKTFMTSGYIYPELGKWMPSPPNPSGGFRPSYNDGNNMRAGMDYIYNPGMGPKHAYSVENYRGYDPLAYKYAGTQDEYGRRNIVSLLEGEAAALKPMRSTPELNALMESKYGRFGMGFMPPDFPMKPSLMSPSTGDGTYSRGRHKNILGLLGR